MTNVDLVKSIYANFEKGDVSAALALFDPAMEWRECPGMPFVKGDGVFIGPEAVVTNVLCNYPLHLMGLRSSLRMFSGKEIKLSW